ncbi:MAG TPA: class I tRNA ligase family protein [Candidatus Paceibacterota bacterium]|nr:class I tRNA ligase family protein [Candidatus Paceibacterota bacterium]
MVDDRKQGGEEMHHAPENDSAKSDTAKREEGVLAFWNEHKIFERSLEKPSPKGEFVFYDGPPFANGLPHYGHILASAIKDAIPRYRTMQGYRVARRWGWDCHGLPVENLVEKELGFKTKRDIEAYGIGKFNEAARASIMKDVNDWKRIVPRMGRWADMEDDYKTMDSTYTESVWWSFQKLYSKGLIYEGFKAMHLCPRCGTTLSNFEVAQGYQDIKDFAVTVRLPLVDEKNTSLLIWTTTPWTLPGNVAAAVKADAVYVKVKIGDEFVVVAKELAHKVLGESLDIVGEMLGKELVGKSYAPPFEYFKDELHKHRTHAWKVYAAPYVTLEDGTGIVHLAPAYGAEDLELAQKEKIPLIHHVTDEGKFIATVADFAGLPVKPKGRHTETDALIVENLKGRGLLFKDEKITHSYPHCWRCDTPLLNWAANSWFVKVSALKKNLLAENQKVEWVPEHVGKGRFRNGLESAPDWAISRTRYWGAPLPVWRNKKTKDIKVMGSVEELLKNVRRSGNTYFVMRHGEAIGNVEDRLDSTGRPDNHLTETGRGQVAKAAESLKSKQIDMIITSPILRTRETAGIVQKELGLPDQAVMVDQRLREFEFGIFSGKTSAEFHAAISNAEQFVHAPEGGESFMDVRRRMGDFLFEIERRYVNKNILIVTHGNPIWLLSSVADRTTSEELRSKIETLPDKASVKELPFTPFPHNADYDLDLHRPYIDEVPMGDPASGQWERVPDVFDCWFESGSMPFASNHYPFEKDTFDPRRVFGLMPKGFPADFIAEGLDQTRGWFYSLIVLSTALFGRSPYKNVIVNGLVLAQDGQKMSKRLKNYPDPMDVADGPGVDALRYYLLSSPVIRGEDLNFVLRGVEDVNKKLLMRLDNVRSFYVLYADGTERSTQSAHVLDRWIISRLGELVRSTTDGFEKYELDVAARPLAGFIDDLSTWYLRRSRDRFKENTEDKKAALSTLRYVLYTVAHVMAPVMPFYAETLYQAMKENGDQDSVHLSNWPAETAIDEALIKEMELTRALSSKGLELREQAGIKVRQPLASLTIPKLSDVSNTTHIISDEINVKTILEDPTLVEPKLDTVLTQELQEEGTVRTLMRRIQEWRKEQNLTITDRPDYTLVVTPEEKVIAQMHRDEIMQGTGLGSLNISTE